MSFIPDLQPTQQLDTGDEGVVRQGTTDFRIPLELAATLSWAKRQGYVRVADHFQGIEFLTSAQFSTANGLCYFVKAGVTIPYTSLQANPALDINLTSRKPPNTLLVVTTSQTYTPTVGAKSAKVTLVGGGGGTGGVEGQGAGTGGQSGGAGAGATAIILILELESSYTIVIGAGGIGGVAGNNDGANGGTSSFIGDDTASTSLTTSGGEASLGFTASTGSHIATGGVGGVASGGDLNIVGNQGGMGNLVLGTNAGNGHGAASLIGSTVRGGRFTENGIPAFSFGSAAGGAAASGTLLDYAGADGFQGVCIIEEFF